MEENAGKIEVRICAIQRDYIILESITDQKIIFWPVNQLNKSLEVGHRFWLELINGGQNLLGQTSSNNFPHPVEITNNLTINSENESKSKEEIMRKTLEALVN